MSAAGWEGAADIGTLWGSEVYTGPDTKENIRVALFVLELRWIWIQD